MADEVKVGLKHSVTIRVGEELAVPASGRLFGIAAEMPPVFATPYLVALVEWAAIGALAPCLAPNQRTVGTRIELNHTAATPIGMQVTAEVELVEIDGRRLRFKVGCRDDAEPIADGFHDRAIIDYDRFLARLARKPSAG